jgi:hypothetical protein
MTPPTAREAPESEGSQISGEWVGLCNTFQNEIANLSCLVLGNLEERVVGIRQILTRGMATRMQNIEQSNKSSSNDKSGLDHRLLTMIEFSIKSHARLISVSLQC